MNKSSLRLTSSGKQGVIFNGIADWLYEEVILQSHVAHWWSPDGERLAFLMINDSLVPSMDLPHFTGSLYPKGQQYPYPKNEEPVFSQDCRTFFLTVPVKNGGHGAFHHIAMFSDLPGNEEVIVRPLTSGNWEDTQILAFDETQHTIVSTAAPSDLQCLTCDIHKDRCTYYSAEISSSIQHIILNCEGPDIPKVTVHRLSDMINVNSLENNTKFREAMRGKKTLHKEIRTISIESYELPLQLTFPADFNENNLYPLLLIVDGAPGSQLVTDRFLLDWDLVLVSSHDVIVARFDGRGSGFKGMRVLQEVHQRLGTLEIKDQIAAVEDIFPDEGHDIILTESQYYLYNKVNTFFKECFQEEAILTPESKEADE
ncbi:UNVERIFIED_CONTAM: hypothetical protein FKN15_012540 [Acipenser sinensis]